MNRRREDRFPRYTTVAERRASATGAAEKLRKSDPDIQPVRIEGRQIARSFWGKAWCNHLEQFSDFSNRLPRGRSYVRNGSVVDLKIEPGRVTARVAGSTVYEVNISIAALPLERWQYIKAQCGGGIGSVLELLQGKISNEVMRIVCDRDNGLFPHPVDITLDCNCPDWATLCKHLAAVLYGVAARLDQSPELLFLLRGVDHEEMIGAELAVDTAVNTGSELKGDLSEIFGVEIDYDLVPPVASTKTRKKRSGKKGISETAHKQKHRVRKKTTRIKRKSTASMPPNRSVAKQNRRGKQGSRISIARGLRASHIKKLRKHFQLSIAELAVLSKVSPATISRWEKQTGVINTRKATFQSIERVFEMSHFQLMRQLKKARLQPALREYRLSR